MLVKPLDVSLVSQETLRQTEPRTLIQLLRLALNVASLPSAAHKRSAAPRRAQGLPPLLGAQSPLKLDSLLHHA